MHRFNVLFIYLACGLWLPILSVDNFWNTHLRQLLPNIPTDLSTRNHDQRTARRTNQHLDDHS